MSAFIEILAFCRNASEKAGDLAKQIGKMSVEAKSARDAAAASSRAHAELKAQHILELEGMQEELRTDIQQPAMCTTLLALFVS